MFRVFASALAGLCCTLFASICAAGPGELDPAFGVGGIARVPAALSNTTTVLATARQADGKILLAGVTQASPTAIQTPAVGRMNADGTLDTSFGDGGWLVPDISSYASEASAVAISPAADGRVLVGLQPRYPGEAPPAVIRLGVDGALEAGPPFLNGDSFQRLTWATFQNIAAIAEVPGGGIVVAGSSDFAPPSVIALDASGQQNFAFGQGGSASVPLIDQGASAIRALYVRSDGTLFVGGWTDAFGFDLAHRDLVVAKLAASGAPDTQFGTGGRVTLDFANGDDEATFITEDSQSRLVIGGRAGFVGYNGESGLGVVRLDAVTGAVDASFGSGGKVQIAVDPFPGYRSNVAAIVFSGNGDLLLGGYATFYSDQNPYSIAVIARIDGSGNPVASFGTGGLVASPRTFDGIPTGDSFVGLTVNAGSLIAVGTRGIIGDPNNPSNGPVRSFVLRQAVSQSDGSPQGDAFTGQALHTIASVASRSIALPDGRFLTVGTGGDSARVMRFLPDGTLDVTFGTSGIVDFQVGGNATSGRAIATDAAGSIYVASLVQRPEFPRNPGPPHGSVARLTADGQLDPEFGNGDASIGDLDSLGGIALQADGSVLVAGAIAEGMVVARLDRSGALDASFAGAGVDMLPIGVDRVTALSLRPDGSILVGGYVTQPIPGTSQLMGYGVVAQLTPAGALDPAWAGGFFAMVQSNQGGALLLQAMAPQPDGKLIVAGTSIDVAHNFVPAEFVARVDLTGQLDFTFGLSGFVDNSAALPGSYVSGMGVDLGGKIVVAGDFGPGTPFAKRYTHEGMLDTSYGVGGVAEVADIRSDDWVANVFNFEGAVRFMGYTNLASGLEELLITQVQGQATFDEPEPFSFPILVDLPVSQFVVSPPVTITGINVPVPISVSEGEYSIGCGANFSSSPGSITNGQSVCVRVMSCAASNCGSLAQLTVGSVSAVFVVNTGTLPDTSITALPAASSTSRRFAFGSNDTTATFRCSLDGAEFTACTTPLSLTGLAEGDHVLKVAAVNRIGADASPAQATWRIDLTPPETTITSGPEGKRNPDDATFEFVSSEAGSTFECSLDQATFAACTSPITYDNLDKGSHTFQVRARDAAGNVDPTPASVTWKSKKK